METILDAMLIFGIDDAILHLSCGEQEDYAELINENGDILWATGGHNDQIAGEFLYVLFNEAI